LVYEFNSDFDLALIARHIPYTQVRLKASRFIAGPIDSKEKR
jgi:hypothetical protein